jgi:2'-5' RNA ligase
MPFAFTLRLDTVSAASIEAMWRILAAEGIDAERNHLGYAPHITLAIYPDEVSADVLQAAFADVTASWQALPVTLSGFGVFPGSASVVWVAPVVTRDLLARHAMLCDVLPHLPVDPHYRRDAWVPHITLTGAIQDPGRAITSLLPHWKPMAGFLDQADLVRFRPVEVVASRTLPSSFAD